MFTAIGKFFTSVAVGLSSILGIHHTLIVQNAHESPVLSPTSQVGSTTFSPASVNPPSKAKISPVSVLTKPTAITPFLSGNTSPIQTSPSIVATVTPTETPPTPKPKVTVTAIPSTIQYDGTSTVSWAATNALSCTLGSPVLLATKGSQLESPTDHSAKNSIKNITTYTVTCTGAGGSTSEKVAVTVQPLPISDSNPEVETDSNGNTILTYPPPDARVVTKQQNGAIKTVYPNGYWILKVPDANSPGCWREFDSYNPGEGGGYSCGG